MLLPDITSIRVTDTSLAGIGRSTESAQSLGSLFDRTETTDIFQPSMFSSSALSGLYTEQGTMASPLTSLQTVSAFSTTQTEMTGLGGSFPSPLSATTQTPMTSASQAAGLFTLQFSQPGSILDLLA